MHDGFATIGELELAVDGHQGKQNATTFAYVRPHDIEIRRTPENGSTFAATVVHIHAIGPIVRLELAHADATEYVEAELTRERFRELALQEGDQVYVKPREIKVFVEEDKSGGGKPRRKFGGPPPACQGAIPDSMYSVCRQSFQRL